GDRAAHIHVRPAGGGRRRPPRRPPSPRAPPHRHRPPLRQPVAGGRPRLSGLSGLRLPLLQLPLDHDAEVGDVRRLRELPAPDERRPLLDLARQHALLPRCLGPAGNRGGAGAGDAAQPAVARDGGLSRCLLCADDRPLGGRVGDMGLVPAPTVRGAQLRSRPGRPAQPRLVRRPRLGDARPRHRLAVGPGQRDGHLPGRPAGHPGRALRGGGPRWSIGVGADEEHHGAAANPGDPFQRHHRAHPRLPVLRAAVRDHRRWPSRRHPRLLPLPLRHRLPVLQDGVCVRDGLGPVRDHPDRDRGAPPHLRTLGFLPGRNPL
ncbi:MAG: N-Acetyl-D-glucosamine ABC transport system, permease protein 1, partial [uncultured Thermomicrobiales bacterium]